MKVTTVTAEMAVGSLLAAGVLPGPVPVGGELVPPHAARNIVRSSRRHKQHAHDKRYRTGEDKGKQGEDKPSPLLWTDFARQGTRRPWRVLYAACQRLKFTVIEAVLVVALPGSLMVVVLSGVGECRAMVPGRPQGSPLHSILQVDAVFLPAFGNHVHDLGGHDDIGRPWARMALFGHLGGGIKAHLPAKLFKGRGVVERIDRPINQ